MVLLEGGNDASDEAVDGEDEDDGANDAVDEPHGADVEVGAHLIDKERDDGPPQQSAHYDEGIAHGDVIPLVFGQRETKARKQRDNQEHDKRIAQREQEACNHIPPTVIAGVNTLLDLADRIVDNHVDGIGDQDDAADNLQDVDVVGDKIGHERDAQPHEQTVEQIARRSSHSGEKSRAATIVQCALDA